MPSGSDLPRTIMGGDAGGAPLQANAWLSSFAISVAVSIAVLQTLKALMGGVLATALSTAAVGTAITVLAVSADIAMH